MERIKVLIADDHPLFREGVARLLEAEKDMEVLAQAGDGEEVVKLATELLPHVAVIDAAMPKLNGIEAARQIKTACPGTSILIISAFSNESYLFGAVEAGAAGYMSKTVRGQELVTAIRALHNGETVLDSSAAHKIFERAARASRLLRAGDVPAELHPRQLEVLKLTARGMSNLEIAQELTISRRTVQVHLTNIFTKLRVGSRTEAVGHALKEGWLTLDDLP